MNYDWRILRVEVIPKYQDYEDIVSTIHWELCGYDDVGTTGYVADKTPIAITEIPSFIPYVSVGPAIMLDWIKNNLTDDQLAAYYNNIKAQIDEKNKAI